MKKRSETKNAYIELHIAVFLFGFTAILGDLIDISPIAIVWWRVLISWISFLFLINIVKSLKDLSTRHIFTFLGIGFIISLHWITFFWAIKVSNASITLICLATTSLFTSILEPLMFKRSIYKHEILLGLMILLGMLFIVNGVGFQYRIGILLGLSSAFFAATFSILNKKHVHTASPKVITAIELFGVWVFVSIFSPIAYYYNADIQWMPSRVDFVYLFILALLCTTVAYVLSMRALKHLSAFATNLVVNLEPVYGILLAILILQEHKNLSSSFYAGVFIICLAVFSYPYIRKKTS